jgi:excisionase family DNA binding protein
MVHQRIQPMAQSMSPSLSTLLTTSDVAVILSVSPKTVNKRVREKKLACVQLTSRDRRFTHEQVQEYIQSQSTSVRVDKRYPGPVSSQPKKGGTKSSGVTRAELRKELSSWR